MVIPDNADEISGTDDESYFFLTFFAKICSKNLYCCFGISENLFENSILLYEFSRRKLLQFLCAFVSCVNLYSKYLEKFSLYLKN